MELKRQTPEDHAQCQRLSRECAHLNAIAQNMHVRKAALQARCDVAIVRKEYAAGSILHRGYYCPSPTYDIIVGGAKRGKLLKRLTCVSKPSHEYGFDVNGKLLYCKWLHCGHPSFLEYLVYEDDRIYGMTFSKDGDLAYLTEEVFQFGKLFSYTNGMFLSVDGAPHCYHIMQEFYEYDDEGLSVCDMHQYAQPSAVPPGVSKELLALNKKPIYDHIGKFQFQRQNGLLISYTDRQGHNFPVRAHRNA